MPEALPHHLLTALRYQSADPATVAERELNEKVCRLNRMLAVDAVEQHSGAVVPLRAGGRR